jgi:hypothetical protein
MTHVYRINVLYRHFSNISQSNRTSKVIQWSLISFFIWLSNLCSNSRPIVHNLKAAGARSAVIIFLTFTASKEAIGVWAPMRGDPAVDFRGGRLEVTVRPPHQRSENERESLDVRCPTPDHPPALRDGRRRTRRDRGFVAEMWLRGVYPSVWNLNGDTASNVLSEGKV